MTTDSTTQPTTNISPAQTLTREFLNRSETTTTTNQPTTIPKNNVPVKDYSIENNCRRALLNFFDEHDPDNLKNPISRRLLELISSDDLDQESKQELTKVFIHSPPPKLETTIKARKLSEFKKPLSDPGELLKHRYLCKGGGLLLVGPTGHGKSSLAMQFMIKWALGQSVFGFEPARPLKSLLIQAENDDGDLAEMKSGVFNGLGLSEDEQDELSENVFVAQESSKTGSALCSEVLDPLLTTHKPDLLWIDPALAYLGGDMNNQKDVGAFLRNHLAPLLLKHQCAVVIIHHTNKISKDPEKQMTDFTYLGAGSAEWSNWSRAIIALNKTDVDNLYELIAAKRGARLKWRTADGEGLAFKKYIGHCKRPDTICWVEMAIAEAEELRANNGKSVESVLKHVPQSALVAKDDLIRVCGQNGIGKQLAAKLIAELVGEERLFELALPRNTVRPKIMLSRVSLSLPANLSFESCIQNSSGHYIIPAHFGEGKKEL